MLRKTFVSVSLALALSVPAFSANLDQLMNQLSPQLRARVQTMVDLGADENAVADMVQSMIQNRVQNRIAVKMMNQVIEAERQGLPADPIISKAEEGFAKGVSTDKIVKAMQKTRSMYEYAYKQAKKLNVSEEAQEQIADNIANALAAGISEKEMNQIMAQIQQRTRTMSKIQAQKLAEETTKTAATFAMYGVSGEKTLDTIENALKNNASVSDMKQVRETLMNGARYMSAQMVADRINRTISNGGMSAVGSMKMGKAGNSGSGLGGASSHGGVGGSAGASGGMGGGPSGGGSSGGSGGSHGGSHGGHSGHM